MSEIYHCGYPGRSPEDLRRIAEALDATVVDIRYSALMAPEAWWRGAALREILGDRYVRCIALADHDGCTRLADHDGCIELADHDGCDRLADRADLRAGDGSGTLIDFSIGVDFLRQISGAMILLCGCGGMRNSHRAAVARRLRVEHCWDSKELDWERDARFHALLPCGALSLRRREPACRR